MRAAWVAAAILCGGACEKASDVTRPRDLVITFLPPKVGERAVTHQDETSTFEVTDPALGTMTSSETSHEVQTSEILEVRQQCTVRMRESFRELSKQTALNGEVSDTTPPIAGHTYVLARDPGGTLGVYGEDGRSAPSSAERAELVRRNQRFGHPDIDAIERLFAARPWRRGVEVALSAEERVRAGHELGLFDGRAWIAELTFTLRKVDGGVAMFDVRQRVDGGDQDAHSSVTLTGEVDVDIATAHLLRWDLSGPITGTMRGSTVTGSARETWTEQRTLVP